MDEAARADRVIIINDGKMAFDGTAKEVFSNVEMLHSMGLEAPQGNELINLLRAEGLEIEGDTMTEDECVQTLFDFLSKTSGNKL